MKVVIFDLLKIEIWFIIMYDFKFVEKYKTLTTLDLGALIPILNVTSYNFVDAEI